jgi:hypothetical protein
MADPCVTHTYLADTGDAAGQGQRRRGGRRARLPAEAVGRGESPMRAMMQPSLPASWASRGELSRRTARTGLIYHFTRKSWAWLSSARPLAECIVRSLAQCNLIDIHGRCRLPLCATGETVEYPHSASLSSAHESQDGGAGGHVILVCRRTTRSARRSRRWRLG